MATAALAQSNTSYVTVGDVSKVAGKRGAAVQAKIPVTVKEGYHVNSNKPSNTVVYYTGTSRCVGL